MNERQKKQRPAISCERRNRLQAPSPLISDPVECPDSPLLTSDQARPTQELQMMADRGLVLVELARDVAHAEWLHLVHKQVEHAQPGGIGKLLESRGERRYPHLGQARRGGGFSRLVLVSHRQGCAIGLRLSVHDETVPKSIEACQCVVAERSRPARSPRPMLGMA